MKESVMMRKNYTFYGVLEGVTMCKVQYKTTQVGFTFEFKWCHLWC